MRCTNLEERYCKTFLLLVYTLFYRVVVRTILQYTFMHPLVTVINTNSSKVVFKGTSLHFSGNSLDFTRGLILSVFAIFDKSLLTVYVVCPENVHCFPTYVQWNGMQRKKDKLEKDLFAKSTVIIFPMSYSKNWHSWFETK